MENIITCRKGRYIYKSLDLCGTTRHIESDNWSLSCKASSSVGAFVSRYTNMSRYPVKCYINTLAEECKKMVVNRRPKVEVVLRCSMRESLESRERV